MESMNIRENVTAQDAERTLLGILIRWPDQLGEAAYVRTGDFSTKCRRAIFQAVNALVEEGVEVEPITLDSRVVTLTGDSAGGEIAECMAMAISARGVKTYAALVMEAANRRRGAAIGRKLDERFRDPTSDMAKVITAATEELNKLFKRSEDAPSTEAVMTDGYTMIEDICTGARRAYPTGVSALDAYVRGFYPAELTVIGARTGTGKSAFAISTALAAAKAGAKVLFVSTEMSREQLGMRLLANQAEVSMSTLREGKGVSEAQWIRMSEQLVIRDDRQIYWLTGETYLENVIAHVRSMKARELCDIVIIDYIQQLRTFERRTADEWLRLGEISLKLKELAVELMIPVVATAQLNRANEGVDIPGLDSLRGSGSLEQDADNVILLSGVGERMHSALAPDKLKLINMCRDKNWKPVVFSISKQRQGNLGKVLAAFDGEHMRFPAV